MITWMQKHKKWLIVTIWISTIAFVGAGFVGWGSYDYGKSNSTVAIVGDTEVPLKDLQNEYSALYSQYQRMFGEKFNKELAQELKLEDVALQRTIQKYLLMNYANELGLMITDKEVAKELIKMPSFLIDNKFDKNSYLSVLKQNRLTASEFEAQLKQDLLVQKIQKIFNQPLLDNELKNISKLLLVQDKISISIIDSSKIKVKTTKKALKDYWSKNKENYKSQNGYKISFTKITTIDGKTKKEMKKEALKKYIQLKKEKLAFKNTKVIYSSSDFLNDEIFTKIISSEIGKTLKPVYDGKDYYVVKFLNKIEPKALPYKKVMKRVKSDFIISEKNKIIDKKTTNLMANFKGKDIGYLSRDSKSNIKGLNQSEVEKLTQKVLTSPTKIDFVKFNNKIVVFKITNSKLVDYKSKDTKQIKTSIENLKTNLITGKLLEQLKNKYNVQSFLGEK